MDGKGRKYGKLRGPLRGGEEKETGVVRRLHRACVEERQESWIYKERDAAPILLNPGSVAGSTGTGGSKSGRRLRGGKFFSQVRT